MKNIVFALIFVIVILPCPARTITVDDDGPADFNTIQPAINDANDGDTVLILPGIYTGPNNRNISFLGKAITVTSIDPNDPNIVAATIIDCNNITPVNGFGFSNGEDNNSILAGLTITHAINSAIICYGTSPKIAYCKIQDNRGYDGGAIHCEDSNNIVIVNCILNGNRRVSCGHGGGAIYSSGSNLSITNCIITGNASIDLFGGGIYCYETNLTVTNCIISGNSAYDGGGIYYDYSGSPKIVNCTIADNYAERYGGGIYCEYNSNQIFLMNCIVWGNTDQTGLTESAQIRGGTPNVWYGCIQDANSIDTNIPYDANHFNIDDDPCFVARGYWVDINDTNIPVEPNDPNAVWLDGDYHLLRASPCIEAGNPYATIDPNAVDAYGEPRVLGKRVDIGADEFEIAVIEVTKPEGGEVWIQGSCHNIEWVSYSFSGTVNIAYSNNNGTTWLPITFNVPNTGTYNWLLPSFVNSNLCLVSVAPSIPDSNVVTTKSGIFTIHPDFSHPAVSSDWKSLGGGFDRKGLSDFFGPELACVKWAFQTDGPVLTSITIGAGDRVHVASQDGILYTLNPTNGAIIWTYDINSPLLSAPTVGPDGSVFVGAENGRLYAISIAGTLRWTHTTDGFIYSSPAVSSDGEVYVCSQDGTLYALDSDGSELWTFVTDGPGIETGAILASPSIGPDGTIYVAGTYDPNIYALDPNDGSVLWAYDLTDPCDPNEKSWPFASPVVAPDGTIYQTLIYGRKLITRIEHGRYNSVYFSKLHAIDPNGNLLWAANMTDTNSGLFDTYYDTIEYNEGAPPYPHTYINPSYVRYWRVSNSGFSESALGPDGTIYVTLDDPYLRAVNPDGSIKWVTRLGWLGGFNLTVDTFGYIYAASNDESLYVVSPDGEEVARFEGEDWLSYPVISSNNTIIIADANNTVWALTGGTCSSQVSVLHRPYDISKDRAVNLLDFALLAAGWLQCSDTTIVDPWTGQPECVYDSDSFYLAGDITRNQYVDIEDLIFIADLWLTEE